MMYVRVDGILVLSWSFVKKIQYFYIRTVEFWKMKTERRNANETAKNEMKNENWIELPKLIDHHFFFFLFLISISRKIAKTKWLIVSKLIVNSFFWGRKKLLNSN